MRHTSNITMENIITMQIPRKDNEATTLRCDCNTSQIDRNICQFTTSSLTTGKYIEAYFINRFPNVRNANDNFSIYPADLPILHLYQRNWLLHYRNICNSCMYETKYII